MKATGFRTERQLRRHATASLFCLFAVPGVAGCAPTDINWTEEVKLHDGKVIQVKRRAELTSSGLPTQSRGRYKYHELCYAPMRVYWKSKPVYKPEIFDIVDGKAYVKVPVSGCTECMLHDYPESNALHFVWDGTRWKKIEQKEFPGRLRFNLLSGTHSMDDGSADARGLVTLAYKEKRDAGIYYDMRRTGANSLSEIPGAGSCARCKSINVRTDATAEVFLPSADKSCNFPRGLQVDKVYTLSAEKAAQMRVIDEGQT